MAAKTIEQAGANWKKRLNNLREKGLSHIIQQAFVVLELEAPSYIGVYRDAFDINRGDFPNSLSLLMTQGMLEASAAQHATAINEEGYTTETYVFGVPNFHTDDAGYTLTLDGASEPYPLRIEAEGSPIAGQGQGAWHNAAMAAKLAVKPALRMATL